MTARPPGPIAASESLLATLAEYRQLHVLLADHDPRHAWVRGLERPTELAPEAVAEVEAALGASFSDALLAVFASRVPHLEDVFDMQLGNLAAMNEEAWAAGCSRELLVVARGGDRAFCVPRREHPWATTAVTPWHRLDGAELPRPLQRWLLEAPRSDLWETLCELDLVDADADEPPPHARPEAGPGLVPRLGVTQAAAAAAQARVHHPKFGEGRVLRSVGAGDQRKLDIDFGAGGVRTILARFVRELERDA
jgi:hypothetical protein